MALFTEADSLLQSAFSQLKVLYAAPESLGVFKASDALLTECFALKKAHKKAWLNSDEVSRLRHICAECCGLAAELAIKNYELALDAAALGDSMSAASGAHFVYSNVVLCWSLNWG